MALTTRNTTRTTALINPIISTICRQITTSTTPTTIDTSVPFTPHNRVSSSRKVETKTSELLAFFRTTSLIRRTAIPANSLYNHYGVEIAAKSPVFYKTGDYVPGLKADGKDLLAASQACKSAKDFALKNGPLFAGQHFMRIKPDNQRLASPLSVFMNSQQSMLKSTSAHFSSSAGSQEVPLDKDHGIQSAKKHLRPLSPHLSVYKPQSSSMFSIFNRISAAMLTVLVLSFTLLTMKMGYICLSYAYFYQLFFYLSKLIPLSIEISALTLAYHLLHSGYLLLRRIK